MCWKKKKEKEKKNIIEENKLYIGQLSYLSWEEKKNWVRPTMCKIRPLIGDYISWVVRVRVHCKLH